MSWQAGKLQVCQQAADQGNFKTSQEGLKTFPDLKAHLIVKTGKS